MKKYLLVIIFLIMISPFIVNAETCDTNKLSISSISLEEKSGKTTELGEASTNGKSINLNLSMEQVGDNIKYKVMIKNDSNEDYKLDKNSFIKNSNYIDYSIEYNDNSNIIKAKSSKTVYLKINYKTEVPDEVFNSGVFKENKNIVLQLSNGKKGLNLKNPNTSNSILLLIIIVLVMSIAGYFLLRNKKYAQFMILFITTTIIIPISIHALCVYNIKIESNIEIKKDLFTGTIYRLNRLNIKNGSNITKGYILDLGYINPVFDTLAECESHKTNEAQVCESYNETLLNYRGIALEPSNINVSDNDTPYTYLRHEVKNNIIKSTAVCFIDYDIHYCMNGADNGASYETNTQIIRDYMSKHSYCTGGTYDNKTSCSGAYGMYISSSLLGDVAYAYYTGFECNVTNDGYSYCNHE